MPIINIFHVTLDNTSITVHLDAVAADIISHHLGGKIKTKTIDVSSENIETMKSYDEMIIGAQNTIHIISKQCARLKERVF